MGLTFAEWGISCKLYFLMSNAAARHEKNPKAKQKLAHLRGKAHGLTYCSV